MGKYAGSMRTRALSGAETIHVNGEVLEYLIQGNQHGYCAVHTPQCRTCGTMPYAVCRVKYAVREHASSLIIHQKLDILAVTDSWLNGDERDEVPVADIVNALLHFTIQHSPWKNRRGGGVCLIAHRGFNVRPNEVQSFQSFEYLDALLVLSNEGSAALKLVIIYWPPPYQQKTNSLWTCSCWSFRSSWKLWPLLLVNFWSQETWISSGWLIWPWCDCFLGSIRFM